MFRKWAGSIALGSALLSLLFSASGSVLSQEDSTLDQGTPSIEENATESGPEIQILLRPDGGVDSQRMEVIAEPGQSTQLAVYVGNAGLIPVKVFTFTGDALTRVNGGMVIAPDGSEQHEPTTWISYPSEELTIEPGTELRREFPLAVPAGTAPGEYVVPIALETVDSVAVQGSSALRQKVRKVMAIYITVPGETVASFDLGEPQSDYVRGRLVIRVPIINTGDLTIRLVGRMTITDGNGEVVFEDQALALGAIYRKAESALQVNADATKVPPGEYVLTVQMEDSISGVSNGFENRALTVLEPTSPEIAPFEWGNILISPNADPIQFASLAVEIYNGQETRRGAKLVLIVEKDGAPLEEFVVADNMTLETGTTTVTQRYLPLTGWETGSYKFSLRLEATDSDGTATELLTTGEVATIVVP